MRTRVILLVILSIISLSIISCTNSNPYDQNKIDKLVNAIKNNKDIPLEIISMGYNSDEKITAWIYPKYPSESVMDYYHISNYNIYDFYVSKKILDLYPEVNSVWVFGGFINITREIYDEKNMADLPQDESTFLRLGKKLEDYIDLNNDPKTADGLYYPNYESIPKSIRDIAGKRVIEDKIIEISFDAANYEATIEGLPITEHVNNELKIELSKFYVASIGRYYIKNFGIIFETSILYQRNNKPLFKFTMQKKDYEKWQKAGLNPNDVYNYCKVELYDQSIRPLFENGEKIEFNYQHNSIENLNYEQTMEELKKVQGLDVVLLTTDSAKDRIVMLRIKDTKNLDEVYQKEMELTHQIMKLPVNDIYFLSEDKDKIRILNIDRDRYNLLLYMDNQDKFDFQPDKWPIMASICWEIDKTK